MRKSASRHPGKVLRPVGSGLTLLQGFQVYVLQILQRRAPGLGQKHVHVGQEQRQGGCPQGPCADGPHPHGEEARILEERHFWRLRGRRCYCSPVERAGTWSPGKTPASYEAGGGEWRGQSQPARAAKHLLAEEPGWRVEQAREQRHHSPRGCLSGCSFPPAPGCSLLTVHCVRAGSPGGSLLPPSPPCLSLPAFPTEFGNLGSCLPGEGQLSLP